MTMTFISRVELGSDAAQIDLTSIPSTFTDLYVLFSIRTTRTSFQSAIDIYVNGSNSNLSGRVLYGVAGETGSYTTSSPFPQMFAAPSTVNTSNTFGSVGLYIPNYTSSANKSFSVDYVTENNASSPFELGLSASLWSSSSAITAIRAFPRSGENIVAGSSATLYGVLKGSDGVTTVS